ncbi:MAG: hypothetical protein GOMPHAMPRED_000630 [Gomphillus americanus]|uniref:Uncharacterized protein n=1 Tax=Gomphillus americanus TaxID=1940652 RepID=A0A8H3EJ56_9LECA|nr:MAG: hypothetical protein GOMPHAMPRED_000630 [Gomphillus americanus]
MHKIVRYREEAAEYLKEILKLEGIQIEIREHIFINRDCVHCTSGWFNQLKYLGLLAAPYDVTKDAIMGHDPAIQFHGTSVELAEQIVHKPRRNGMNRSICGSYRDLWEKVKKLFRSFALNRHIYL